MHLRHVILAAVVGSMFVAGCRTRESASDVSAAQVRESLQRRADAQVGFVSAVLPEKGLLAISQVDITKFFVGDTFVLMSPDQKIIGAGRVVAKGESTLHLSYDVNADGRLPKVGDLAVKPTM